MLPRLGIGHCGGHFYREVEVRETVAKYLPQLLGFDSKERLLRVEELGELQDFTFLYSHGGKRLEEAELTV